LRAFFESAGIPIDADQEDIDLTDADKQAKLRDSFVNFAEYLFENFFLPCMLPSPARDARRCLTVTLTVKSSTKKTPQPSPASHSAVQQAQGGEGQNFLGTPERVSALRGACLLRDRHRCVISRKFDDKEALRRMQDARRQGGVAQDDDGNPLVKGQGYDSLEVAHIMPHSLTQLNASKQLVCDFTSPNPSSFTHYRSSRTLPRKRHWRFLICSTMGLHFWLKELKSIGLVMP
jgi:hypothetical protein